MKLPQQGYHDVNALTFEFLRLFIAARKPEPEPMPDSDEDIARVVAGRMIGHGGIPCSSQIDVELSASDLAQPRSEFVERILRPAAARLAESTNHAVRFVKPAIPAGLDAVCVATDTDTEISVRYTRDFDVYSGSFVSRFDCVFYA